MNDRAAFAAAVQRIYGYNPNTVEAGREQVEKLYALWRAAGVEPQQGTTLGPEINDVLRRRMSDLYEGEPQQGACSHKWRPLSWGYSYCEHCGASDPTLEAVKVKAFVDGIEEARRLDSVAGAAHQAGTVEAELSDIEARRVGAAEARGNPWELNFLLGRAVALARRLQAQHPEAAVQQPAKEPKP
jgi:hypothetical protein